MSRTISGYPVRLNGHSLKIISEVSEQFGVTKTHAACICATAWEMTSDRKKVEVMQVAADRKLRDDSDDDEADTQAA